MKKQSVYVVFENNLCQIGSQLDLINFDELAGEVNTIGLSVIPRVGESLELPMKNNAGMLPFEVLGVHYRVSPYSDDPNPQSMRLLLRQVSLEDWNKQWYF